MTLTSLTTLRVIMNMSVGQRAL